MALDLISLSMLEPLIAGASVHCFGVPDMPADALPFREWALGNGAARVSASDIIRHVGWEEIVDLNEPQNWRRKFNLVINPGTLEHCFNIGQAWANAWDVVEVGGHLLSIAPVTMLNHGYWNVNPIAFTDWCVVNGGWVRELICSRNGDSSVRVHPEQIPNSKSGRGCFPPETVVYALMQKTEQTHFQWPTQGVYR